MNDPIDLNKYKQLRLIKDLTGAQSALDDILSELRPHELQYLHETLTVLDKELDESKESDDKTT